MNLHRIAPWLLGTGICLGLGAPIAKAASLAGVGPLAFTLWPTLAAGLMLASLGLLRQGRPEGWQRLLRFGGVAGLFGHALPMSALFWLASHAGAAFASLSLALPPVFTLLTTILLGIERVAPRRVAAVGVGLLSALLMLAGRGGTFEATPAALAVALLIPASIGAANVYRSRHMPPGASGEWLSATTLLASSSMLAVSGPVLGDVGVPLHGAAMGWLALQAGVLTVGYLFYFGLQRRAGPVTFSLIGYVMMLSGVAVATLAFGERLPWTVGLAAVLVLVALLLLSSPAGPNGPVAGDAARSAA